IGILTATGETTWAEVKARSEETKLCTYESDLFRAILTQTMGEDFVENSVNFVTDFADCEASLSTTPFMNDSVSLQYYQNKLTTLNPELLIVNDESLGDDHWWYIGQTGLNSTYDDMMYFVYHFPRDPKPTSGAAEFAALMQ
ncbi:hypothetical protein KIPB_015609, partial [Kipferlia bialata]